MVNDGQKMAESITRIVDQLTRLDELLRQSGAALNEEGQATQRLAEAANPLAEAMTKAAESADQLSSHMRQLDENSAATAEGLRAEEEAVRLVTSGQQEFLDILNRATEEQNAYRASVLETSITDERRMEVMRQSAGLMSQQIQGLREYVAELHDEVSAETQVAESINRQVQAQRTAQGVQQELGTAVTGTSSSMHEQEAQLQAMAYGYLMVAQTALHLVESFGEVVQAAIEQEYALARIQRYSEATNAEMGLLNDQLVKLSETIPVPFEELAKIAQIGASLGIASDALAKFTEVVATYSADTGIAAEAAANFFARMAQFTGITTGEFDNLGSAIAAVGAKMAATDLAVQRVTESLAPVAAGAGFAADQIVGLGGAFASLGIAPYLARGAALRLLNDITSAADSGGLKLEIMAQTLGITSDAAATLAHQDLPGFFQRLVDALGRAGEGGKNLQSIMREMGVTNTNDIVVLQRLAEGYQKFDQSMTVANVSFKEGTALQQQAGPTFATTAAHVQEFEHALTNAAAQAGKPFLGPLNTALDFLKSLLGPLTGSLDGVSTAFTGLAATVGVTVVGVAGYRAALAFLATFIVNTRAATEELGISQLRLSSILGAASGATVAEAEAMTVVSATATEAEVATTGLGVAARGLLASMGPLGWTILAAGAALTAYSIVSSESSDKTNKNAVEAWNAVGGQRALAEAVATDTAAWRDHGAVLTLVKAATDQIDPAVRARADALDAEAQANQRAILATYGSLSALEAAAAAEGRAGGAATDALKRYQQQTDVIRQNTTAVQGNTVAIGEETAKKFQEMLATQIQTSEMVKSDAAMERVRQTGLRLGAVNDLLAKGDVAGAMNLVNQALNNAKTSYDEATGAAERARVAFMASHDRGLYSSQTEYNLAVKQGVQSYTDVANAAKGTRDDIQKFYDALNGGKNSITDIARQNILLADGSKIAGAAAVGTAKALDDESAAADVTKTTLDGLNTTLGNIAGPSQVWQGAMEKAQEAVSKTKQVTDSAKVSVQNLVDTMNERFQDVQNYAANLITVMSRVPAEFRTQLAQLGPDSAGEIALMTKMSDAELQKFVRQMSITGSNGASALGDALGQATPYLSLEGGKAGKLINDQIAKAFQDAMAGNGTIAQNLQRLQQMIKALDAVKADPKVDLDHAPFDKGMAAVIQYVLEAETGHKMDPQGKAFLDSGEFDSALKAIQDAAGAVNKNGSADVNGTAHLNIDEYKAQMGRVHQEMQGFVQAGYFDPKGTAHMSTEAYYASLGGMSSNVRGWSNGGSFDAHGNGTMNTGAYYASLGGMSNTAQGWSNSGYFNARGTGRIDTDNYYGQLNNMNTRAQQISSDISNALNITAAIYYTYKATNAPPSNQPLSAAGGGWVNGPGGPTDDAVPARLSNGEFVVNAAAASIYGAWLEVINTQGGRGGTPFLPARTGPGPVTDTPLLNRLAANLTPGVAPQVTAMPTQPSGAAIIFHINNQYPQAEPTSVTVNRSLALAATISGV